MQVTLQGRPSEARRNGPYYIVTMLSGRPPALPRELPQRPLWEHTAFQVYIPAQQWRRVVDVLRGPEVELVVEGFPQLDLDTRAVELWATSVSTTRQPEAA